MSFQQPTKRTMATWADENAITCSLTSLMDHLFMSEQSVGDPEAIADLLQITLAATMTLVHVSVITVTVFVSL